LPDKSDYRKLTHYSAWGRLERKRSGMLTCHSL
jgi:hypothetical protein